MLDKAFLAQISAILAKRENQLLEQLADVSERASTVVLDQQSVGRVSRVDALQQQAMAVANQAQATNELNAITLAQRELADDEFGYCKQCDEYIAEARLLANPSAQYCVACQTKIESSK